jgi:hypothetical protein
MTLTVGYAATSSSTFTVTGSPTPSVVKSRGDSRITWNSSTRKLDIATGLSSGVYEVELMAQNTAGTFRFTFTLKVEAQVYYVDIPSSFVGGTITATTPNNNPYLAEESQTVTLTITPDAGYELASINVYISGTTTPVALSGTGLTRTFVMPANHVSVVAVFKDLRTGIDDIQRGGLKAYAQNGVLYVSGISENQSQMSSKSPTSLKIYNTLGTLIYQGIASSEKAEIPLPARGMYIVTDGKESVKVMN